MWRKLVLLTLYLVFLFILCRILEKTPWYNDNKQISATFSLSVRQLKALLNIRGVDYSGVFEKNELVDLVHASGHPTVDDLDDAEVSSAQPVPESTRFTCGTHFFEEVEDTKDSAWLVQVVTNDGSPPLIGKESWNKIKSDIGRFGVRAGVFKCSKDAALCKVKNWTSPRLILALPRGNKAKQDVIMHVYMMPSTPEDVMQWVRKHLSTRVRKINSDSDLEQWTTYSDTSIRSEIRIILFTLLKSTPMFLSALAIKFNGRARFGMVDVSQDIAYKKYVRQKDLPVYMIVTPEKTLTYGTKKSECYNFKSMGSYLRTFVPEVNDIFLWSLFLVNALASFELFFLRKQVWKQLVMFIACVVKYNCVLFILWLMILGLYQFPYMYTCTDFAMRILRVCAESEFAATLRSDYKLYSTTFISLTFVTFGCAAAFIMKKFRLLPEDELSISPWSFFPTESFISRHRPIQESDIEVGLELLIERMATPNLWLQPVISLDYIKYLPMWHYQGWCEADDAAEDAKTNRDEDCHYHSSDDDNSLSSKPKAIKVTLQNIRLPDDPNNISCQKEELKCNLQPRLDVSIKNVCHDGERNRAPEGMQEIRNCAICLEHYHYGDPLCGLPCGHNFHMVCIMTWLCGDNHCCPICRWPPFRPKRNVRHMHSQ